MFPAPAHRTRIPKATINQRMRFAVGSSRRSSSPFRRIAHVRNHTDAIKEKASEKKLRGGMIVESTILLAANTANSCRKERTGNANGEYY
jgi:hypothetical protein